MKLSMINRFREFLVKETQQKLEAARKADAEYDEAKKKYGMLKVPDEICNRHIKAMSELKEFTDAVNELDATDFR